MKPADEFHHGHLIDAFLLEADPPEPSAAHLEQLRRVVLSKTSRASELPGGRSAGSSQPGTGWAEPRVGRRLGRRWRYLGLGLAAGVIGLMALAWGWRQPDNPVTNFRHVLAVAGSHAWVHGVTTVTTATDRFDFETWFSPSQRLAAMRSAKFLQHTNYKTGMQTSYHLASAELRQSLANPHGEHFGRAFVIALLNDGDLQAAMPFHRVSGVNKLLVADGHRPLVQYQFQVSWRSNTSVGWLTTVLVDTDDQRIVSWEERHTNGTVILTRFDYPTTGPDDIYQLGAPLDAVWASDQHPLDESP